MADDSSKTTQPARPANAPQDRRLVEESSGEEYLHKVAWLVAKRQLQHAVDKPTGATLDYLAALVFVSHALEGYTNFLGEKVARERWANEREEFRNSGVAGKLRALEELCGLERLPPGSRPFSIVRELKGIRDRIAHPRTLVEALAATEYAEGKEPPLFRTSWVEKVATRARAERATADVEEIVLRLHRAALPRFVALRLVGPEPLGGILGMRSTPARLKAP